MPFAGLLWVVGAVDGLVFGCKGGGMKSLGDAGVVWGGK